MVNPSFRSAQEATRLDAIGRAMQVLFRLHEWPHHTLALIICIRRGHRPLHSRRAGKRAPWGLDRCVYSGVEEGCHPRRVEMRACHLYEHQSKRMNKVKNAK